MTKRTTSWGLIGVPSSAGGHTPGMDLAPAAIRAAGLADELTRRRMAVTDAGDVRGFRRRPDPDHPDRQNIAEVARVASETADAVAAVLAEGRTPLVVGGDCTVTVGVVAGFHRAGVPAALLYVDGGPDLYTPGGIAYGNVDAMGVAHLLDLPGADPVLAEVDGSTPLLRPEEVVLFGDALPEGEPDIERERVEQLALTRVPAAAVHADRSAAAGAALAAIEAAGERFVIHLDVDVLAHLQMPLANMPNPDAPPWGLYIDELVAALGVFTASDRFAGLVLTEVNPGNAPDPSTLRDYVRMVADAVAP